jgi:hypothetical protein
MRILILLVLSFVLSFAQAAVVEVSPLPPVTSTVPTTATRSVECVAVDDYGNAYCNATYTWKKYVNRFCCSYQRNFSFRFDSANEIAWLTPAAGKTDTRVTAVSSDGIHIGGASQGAKASLPVATLWTNGAPAQVIGLQVDAVSNTAYSSGGAALTYDGMNIKPATCAEVYALNDLGDGVCHKTIVGSDENGIARFSDQDTEDSATAFFAFGTPKTAAINNHGDAVVGFVFYGVPMSIVDYADGAHYTEEGALAADINDSGVYVGALGSTGAVWSSGLPLLLPDTYMINALNAAGQMACTAMHSGVRSGCVIR